MFIKIETIKPVPGTVPATSAIGAVARLSLRRPRAEDGPAVTALIAACPPLDSNSAYCNLLQCSHFADTCVLAEQGGNVMGWLSGYRLPADPSRFFLWQVAVAATARGTGLAGRMLDNLLARTESDGITYVVASVTAENDASWAMLGSWARRRHAAIARSVMFDADRHFGGEHATEMRAEIGPIAP